jgi:NAD(P)-dependent dehydrogenase (short-subunit alcohol dehydrogenase family)
MANKTIAIVGAGPGLGLSIARRFGAEGFQVALVARNSAKLANLVTELRKDRIIADVFVADVTDEVAVAAAFSDIATCFGQIDVLEYSPVAIPTDPAEFARLNVVALTSAVAQRAFAVMALGAVTSVAQVLPGMLKRGEGTILITMGPSAKGFMPRVGAWGMAGSAVRNYARTLGTAVRGQGVFVASVCLGVGIKKGDPFGDPDRLAETYMRLYRDRAPNEVFINHLPEGALELDRG